MPIFYLFFFLILLIFISPIIVSFLFVYFTKVGFNFLDFSTGTAIMVILFMFLTSFINIPLGKKKLVRTYKPCWFGLTERVVWKSQGVSINVGGAVIPLIIVGILFSQLPLYALFITTAIVVFFSFLSARFIEEKGIIISMILPTLFSAFFALFLAPSEAAQVAFSAGVLGVLIGADILYLPWILAKKNGTFSIGGAGIFDAIFLVGIVSALLTGV